MNLDLRADRSFIQKAVIFLIAVFALLLCRSYSVKAETIEGSLIENNGSSTYLVGDSRTYLGYKDTGCKLVNWLAASGTNYTYFERYYIPYFDKQNLMGKRIVILYGINDVIGFGPETAGENWLNFYRTKAQEWIARGATISVCATLGVDDKLNEMYPLLDIRDLNRKVNEYNSKIAGEIPENVDFIQLFHFSDNPYMDGIHYTPEESCMIYNTLISSL